MELAVITELLCLVVEVYAVLKESVSGTAGDIEPGKRLVLFHVLLQQIVEIALGSDEILIASEYHVIAPLRPDARPDPLAYIESTGESCAEAELLRVIEDHLHGSEASHRETCDVCLFSLESHVEIGLDDLRELFCNIGVILVADLVVGIVVGLHGRYHYGHVPLGFIQISLDVRCRYP